MQARRFNVALFLQVHRAALTRRGADVCGVPTGRVVVIKVKHPRVGQSIQRDFAIMMWAASQLEWFPALAKLRLRESLQQFAAPLREQARPSLTRCCSAVCVPAQSTLAFMHACRTQSVPVAWHCMEATPWQPCAKLIVAWRMRSDLRHCDVTRRHTGRACASGPAAGGAQPVALQPELCARRPRRAAHAPLPLGLPRARPRPYHTQLQRLCSAPACDSFFCSKGLSVEAAEVTHCRS